MKKLIEMTESVIQRMLWRAFFYLRDGPDEVEQIGEKYYGFSSRKCSPQIEELRTFEDNNGEID